MVTHPHLLRWLGHWCRTKLWHCTSQSKLCSLSLPSHKHSLNVYTHSYPLIVPVGRNLSPKTRNKSEWLSALWNYDLHHGVWWDLHMIVFKGVTGVHRDKQGEEKWGCDRESCEYGRMVHSRKDRFLFRWKWGLMLVGWEEGRFSIQTKRSFTGLIFKRITEKNILYKEVFNATESALLLSRKVYLWQWWTLTFGSPAALLIWRQLHPKMNWWFAGV